MISGHGSDRHKYLQEIIADFSSNVWYKGAPVQLISHLQKKVKNIIHYPEPNAEKLSLKIANRFKLNYKNVLVTNGATEAFYLIAQFFQQYHSLIVYPSFSEYEDSCKIFNHKIQFITIDNLIENTDFQYGSLIWLGNPNNPDGEIISKETIELLCKKNPKSTIIIDEAYGELCNGFESSIPLLDLFSNLIIIRSLTKTFAIPGIRLGYVLASEKIIEDLTLIKIPWSVNYLALEAGEFILSKYEQLMPEPNWFSFCKSFQNELHNIQGLKVRVSNCNYYLVQIQNGKACDLKHFLIENYGLLIRDASNFRGLDESFFRIAIQDPMFNKLLIKGINDWLNS